MKKILLTIFGLFFWLISFALPNIFTGATDSNWGTSTNWSLAAVPTAADGNTATFNVTSPNCTVNTSARVCNAIDFTGYTNTLTMTFGITCSGNVTFQANQSSRIAGGQALTINATSAIITNNCTWNNALLFSVAATTKTITGTLTCAGLFTSSTSTQTVNGGTLIMGAGLTMSGNMVGTTNLSITGGTWSGGGVLENNLDFNGNVTVSGSVGFRTSTLSHTSGTITTTGSTLNVATNAVTWDTDPIVWNNITMTGTGQVHPLLSDLRIGGTWTLSNTNGTTQNFTGAFTIYAGGNITQGSTSAIVTGAPIIYNGTGIWSSASTGQLRNNLTINTAGSFTISGNVNYNTGTLTYVAGSTTTTGSTLTVGASTTFNIAGMPIENFALQSSSTATLNSLLTATGTITSSVSSVSPKSWLGTAGFTCLNFTSVNSSGVGIVTFKNGNTYTVTGTLTLTGTAATIATFVSSTPGSFYTFTLSQGATQDVAFYSPTDAHSEGGQTIWTYKGVIGSNVTNWNLLPTQPSNLSTTISN